jgi:hypothetical protein
VHYCVIARDSDMIVFEVHLSPHIPLSMLKSECTDVINAQES